MTVLTEIVFFRLLKALKRLGLGQKVLEKYPFGPNGVRFTGPKNPRNYMCMYRVPK
jgi:hypothetical protein